VYEEDQMVVSVGPSIHIHMHLHYQSSKRIESNQIESNRIVHVYEIYREVQVIIFIVCIQHIIYYIYRSY